MAHKIAAHIQNGAEFSFDAWSVKGPGSQRLEPLTT